MRTATAEIWLGDNGIVHLRPHARREQTLDDAIENVDAVVVVSAGVRRPLLVHFERAAPQTPECRAHYTSQAAARNLSACAIVTASMLGRVIGNLMIGVSETNLPLRLFDAPEPAEKWLLELWKPEPRTRSP